VDLKEFKSYWDLLAPKWKGKILLFERPGVGSPSVVRYYYHAQLGRISSSVCSVRWM
jgi:ABC-type Fe3+ transport system substrate-binding protein